jgi:hypothetical protein
MFPRIPLRDPARAGLRRRSCTRETSPQAVSPAGDPLPAGQDETLGSKALAVKSEPPGVPCAVPTGCHLGRSLPRPRLERGLRPTRPAHAPDLALRATSHPCQPHPASRTPPAAPRQPHPASATQGLALKPPAWAPSHRRRTAVAPPRAGYAHASRKHQNTACARRPAAPPGRAARQDQPGSKNHPEPGAESPGWRRGHPGKRAEAAGTSAPCRGRKAAASPGWPPGAVAGARNSPVSPGSSPRRRRSSSPGGAPGTCHGANPGGAVWHPPR